MDSLKLGFGCMRFPTESGNVSDSKIDAKYSKELIQYAIENGVEYFDTAYSYNNGESERILGIALENVQREKVKVATKLALWDFNSKEDFKRIFSTQLKRLRTDYIDYYLLHSLNQTLWRDKVLKFNLLEDLLLAKKQGLIKNIGFSFHDSIDVFFEIIDYFDWDFCQIQYNYMNEDYQAGRKGLEYATEIKKIPVIVMEPLLGGKLADIKGDINDLFKTNNVGPVELAFKWLLNQKGVSMILSGMNSKEQIKQNVEIFEQAQKHKFSNKEELLLNKIRQAIENKKQINCTQCKYCMPCIEGIDIPLIFELYNDAMMFEDMEESKRLYRNYVLKGEKELHCKECKICEEKCPQMLPISSLISKVDDLLNSF